MSDTSSAEHGEWVTLFEGRLPYIKEYHTVLSEREIVAWIVGPEDSRAIT